MSAASAEVSAIPIADGVWNVDPQRSDIGFAVKAMWGLATVRGSFGAYEGSLTVRAPAVTGELAIDAYSLDTGNTRRDRHLRSQDFFDAERHPRILFTVIAVTPSDRGLTIAGELQIAITRVPLRLSVEIEQTSDGALHLHGTTVISRTAAGLAWNALAMIRDDASLQVRLTLTQAAS